MASHDDKEFCRYEDVLRLSDLINEIPITESNKDLMEKIQEILNEEHPPEEPIPKREYSVYSTIQSGALLSSFYKARTLSDILSEEDSLEGIINIRKSGNEQSNK